MNPPIISASYFIRNEWDLDELKNFSGFKIQIGISENYEVLVEKVYDIVNSENINISSIHTPKFKPFEAEKELESFSDLFHVYKFTIHPDNKSLENAIYEWSPVLRYLKRKGIEVGFENLRKTGAWLRNPYDIEKCKNFKITLDVRHLHESYDDIKTISDLKDRILIVHLSHRAKPGPYINLRKLFPFMLLNSRIEYVLEYGRDYIHIMKRDINVLNNLFADYIEYERKGEK